MLEPGHYYRDLTLAELGDEAARWQADRFGARPDLAKAILGVTKTAEEAGELVGALTKYVEGRGTRDAILDELGDVVIAAAGALARLRIILEEPDLDFGYVVERRWSEVRLRRYEDVDADAT